MDNAEYARFIAGFVTLMIFGVIGLLIRRHHQRKSEQIISQEESLRKKYTFRTQMSAIIAAFFLGAAFTIPFVILSITTKTFGILIMFSPAIALGIFLIFLGIRYTKASITIDDEGLFFPLVIPKEVETIHLWHWVKEPTRIKWEEIKSIDISREVLVIETIHDKKYSYPIFSCPEEARTALILFSLTKQIKVITHQNEEANEFTSSNISAQETAHQETSAQETDTQENRKRGSKKIGIIMGILILGFFACLIMQDKAKKAEKQRQQAADMERHLEHERRMREDSVYRQHWEETMKYLQQSLNQKIKEQNNGQIPRRIPK